MRQRALPLFFVFCFLVFIISLNLFRFSRAESGPEVLGDLQKKRQEYEGKLEALRKTEKTLKNEISFMDTQISLTLLRIEEAQTAIKIREEELGRLQGDISLVGGKIESLARVLERQRHIFAERAAAAYKSQPRGFLEMFLGSFNGGQSFAEFASRFEYLKVFELQDSRFLKQMEETRQVFQSQKIILSDKRDQVSEIKAQIEKEKKNLEVYKSSLSSQKREKQNFLSLTLNDEGKFQQLLTQVLAEIESVSRGLKGGTKIGEVHRGEVIAREGNTGCVVPSPTTGNPLAGSHLHFGVFKDGVAQDPKPYLDRADLAWPESPTIVTQNFGDNFDFYMRNFGVPGHNAMDLSAGYGAKIMAAADGTAYETGDAKQYGPWCNGKAKGLRVEHGNGLVTIYWHVL